VAEYGCQNRHQLMVSGVQVFLFVGCGVVWGGQDVDSGMGCHDFVGFFAAVGIQPAMGECWLDNL
jgi:hypothetical protein